MQHSKLLKTTVVFLVFATLSVGAWPDRILLENGQTLIGKIVSREGGLVRIQFPTALGSTIEITLEDSAIDRVVEMAIEEPEEAEPGEAEVPAAGVVPITAGPAAATAPQPAEELSPEMTMYYQQLRSELAQVQSQKSARFGEVRGEISRLQAERKRASKISDRTAIDNQIQRLQNEAYTLKGAMNIRGPAATQGNAADQYFQELDVQKRRAVDERQRQRRVLDAQLQELQRELRGESKVREKGRIRLRIDDLKAQRRALSS